MSEERWHRPPVWFGVVAVVVVLPSLFFPAMLPGVELPGWQSLLFPAYGIATGALAWYVYDERPLLSWILLSLLVLAYVALLIV